MARALALLAGLGLLGGCSLKGMVADALSETGGALASDEDPELVREAVPFGLKLFESLLQDVPHHRALLLATAALGPLLRRKRSHRPGKTLPADV